MSPRKLKLFFCALFAGFTVFSFAGTPPDIQKQVKDYIDSSSVASHKANSREALNFLFKALRVADSLNAKKEICTCYYKLAVFYDRQGDSVNSLKYVTKGLTLSAEIKDSALQASCMHRLGLLLSNSDPDSALALLKSSLKIREKLKLKSGIAACKNATGLIYLNRKIYDDAVMNFVSAYTLWQEVGDKEGMAIASGNLGSLFLATLDYDKAIQYSRISYDTADFIHSYYFMKEAALTLSKAYLAKKDFEHAYEYQIRYAEIKDTIVNEESAQRIAEIQAQYASDKQEHQITLLTRDKEEQNFTRDVLVVIVLLILLLVLAVLNRYRVKQKANLKLQKAYIEIETSRDEITAQKQEITDSIRYAKRLQEALLPTARLTNKFFSESFILYKPKDIVSGDFYWAEQWGDQLLLAAVDCTGHGVPGAFMSILGFSQLNRAVNELGLYRPSLVLNELNHSVSKLLRQNNEEDHMRDGMDISMISYSPETKKMEYAGAFNSMYIIRDGQLREIRGDRFPIGNYVNEKKQSFTNHSFDVQTGDCVYLFTDGYADQFGGPKGKKFKYKRLQQLLAANCKLSMSMQENMLSKTFEDWKGELEQIDDILLLGIKI